MADAKISQLAALDSFVSGDLIPMVDNPSGIPETKKATINQVKDFVTQSENNFLANNYFANSVGIRTTSPSYTLDVNGSLRSTLILFGSNQPVPLADAAIFRPGDATLALVTNANERMRVNSAGNVGINTTSPTSTLTVNGSLSKSSGSFNIQHPLPELSQTHRLIHSFVESPTADNIYRGRVNLQNGQASVNIDSFFGMTNGTFSALNGNIQVFLQNDSGWDAVRGSVSDSILTIVSQNQQSTDTISWLVIGERQDQHMLDTQWTDEFGRPILEPLIESEPDVAMPEDQK